MPLLSRSTDTLGVLELDFTEGLVGDVSLKLLGASWAEKGQSSSE